MTRLSRFHGASDFRVFASMIFTIEPQTVGSVTAGSRFSSITAFNKFFMAFRSEPGGSLPNLSGYDLPRYINPQGELRPVTQDAPGGGFSVTGVTISPEDVVTPGVWLTGPDITSVVLGGEKDITITIPNKPPVTIKQNLRMRRLRWNPLSRWRRDRSCSFTTSSGQVPVVLNGRTVSLSLRATTSSTTFVVNISGVTRNNSATDGTFAVQNTSALSLTRENNIVTAYLVDTTPEAPTEIQQGWYVNIVDTQATATAQLPDGTVPFTANELFQAIFPSSSGSGGAIGLLTGTTVLWNRWPENTPSYSTPEPTGTYTWTYPGDGGNDPYQPSVNNGQPNAGTFTLENNQSLLFNMEPSGFVPGFGFTNQSTQDNGGDGCSNAAFGWIVCRDIQQHPDRTVFPRRR